MSKAITVTKSQLECYRLRNPQGGYWAEIIIDTIAGMKHGRIMIVSDFGYWQNYWGACGEDFKKHLAGLDIEYAAKKFGADKEFDAETTIAIYSEHAKDVTDPAKRKQIMAEMEALVGLKELSHVVDRGDFIVELSKCNQVMRMFDGCPPLCNRVDSQFKRFWEMMWPVLLQEFKNEESNP